MTKYDDSNGRKKRIMTKFGLNEVSFVNRPAQRPAQASIMKADDLAMWDLEDLMKEEGYGGGPLMDYEVIGTDENFGIVMKSMADLVTSSEDGHQHGIRVMHFDDGSAHLYVSYAAGGEGEQHDHEVVIGADGSVTLTENFGHTHEIDASELQRTMMAALAKADIKFPEGADVATLLKSWDLDSDELEKEAEMPGTKKTEADANMDDQLQEANAKAKKAEDELAVMTAIAAMNDAEKAHYETLDEDGQAAFRDMSKSDRTQSIAKASEADAVVYKADNGTEYRKSDDPRLVQMAKERDEDRRATKAANEALETARLEKAAETDLAHLPGEVAVRVAILKAVEGIEDEGVRDEALKSLKASNADMSKAFETAGKSGVDKSDSVDNQSLAKAGEAADELDRLAKELAEKSDTKMSFEDAYAKVCDDNPKLYETAIAGPRS